MEKKNNKIYWIIGGIILALLILNSYQKQNEPISMKVHYYKNGVEVFPEKSLFSIITPSNGSYDAIQIEVQATNIGNTDLTNITIVDATPLALKNALPATTQSLSKGETKTLWISNLMNTSQFESMAQPVRFWVNISGQDYSVKIVYSEKFINLTITPELVIVSGKIYNFDFSQTINNSYIKVVCNEYRKNTLSLSDGTYAVSFEKNICDVGSIVSVYASKEGFIGNNNGTIQLGSPPIAIVNVGLNVFEICASDDSDVNPSSPDTNNGRYGYFYVGFSQGTTTKERAYISWDWDLNNLPQSYQSAQICLYHGLSWNKQHPIYKVSTAFDEDIITWNNQPCGINFDNPICTPTPYTLFTGPTGQVICTDITSILNISEEFLTLAFLNLKNAGSTSRSSYLSKDYGGGGGCSNYGTSTLKINLT